MSGYDVIEFLDDYKKTRENIEKEIVEIIYYLEGAISYNEAWDTTHENRKIIADVFKKNMEQKQKSKMF